MKLRKIGFLVSVMMIAGCAETPPEATNAQNVASSDAPERSCDEQNQTGSLVQKRVVCTSSDEDRNGVMNSLGGMTRPGGGQVTGH